MGKAQSVDRKYKLGVVSDLHCGSIWGLLPPNFETSAGDIRNQNPGQRYMWDCWLDACQWMRENAVDAVVVNGDVIDGKQRAQHGTELCLNIPKDQVSAAIEALKPLKESVGHKPFYMIQGTEYHDEKAGQAADAVGEAMGFERYQGLGTGRAAKEILDLDLSGVVVNFAHHVGGASGIYRATSLDRESLWASLCGKDGKAVKADCLVRSHLHYFIHLEYAHRHSVITPCWQLQTRFMRKNSAYRMIPDLGAVILCIDPSAKARGEDPIQVKKRLYPLPPYKTTRFAG